MGELEPWAAEFLADLALGACVIVDAPGDQPFRASYLGWVRDERGDPLAVVRPAGWRLGGPLRTVHPSCVAPEGT